ncbi:hypothetical protein HGRIS_001282 [Hohenbuehelia grisea]|uniref:Uncharacterized protein n=1 Tax=Hohenbuehelia grisea TaxID=104357 RepID=A0ABR3JPG1_9AGAR
MQTRSGFLPEPIPHALPQRILGSPKRQDSQQIPSISGITTNFTRSGTRSTSSEPNIVRDRTPEYDAPLLNGAGVVRVPPSNEISDSLTSNSDMEFSDDATSRSHSPLVFAPSFPQEMDPALVTQGYAWRSLMHPLFPNEIMPGRYRVISLGSPFVNWSDVANASQSAPRLNGTAFSPSPHPDSPEPVDIPQRLDHPVYASPFPQPPSRQDQVHSIDFHTFSNERRPSPIDSTHSEDDSVSRNIANDPHGISFTIQSSTTLDSPFRYETQRRLQDPQSIDSRAQQILLDEYIQTTEISEPSLSDTQPATPVPQAPDTEWPRRLRRTETYIFEQGDRLPGELPRLVLIRPTDTQPASPVQTSTTIRFERDGDTTEFEAAGTPIPAHLADELRTLTANIRSTSLTPPIIPMDVMEPRSRTPDDPLPERASLSIQTLDQRLQHVLAQQERYPSIESRITAQSPRLPVSTDALQESDRAADPSSPDSPSLEYLTPPEYPSDDKSHSNQTSQVLFLSTMPTDTVPDEVNDQRGSVSAGPMLPRTRIFDIGPLDRTTPFSHLGYGPEFELSYATSTERARIAEGHTPRIRPGVPTSGQTQVISRLRSEDGTECLELNVLNANLLLQNTYSRVLALDTTFPFEAPMIAQEALHAALVEAGNAYLRPQIDTRSMLELIERQFRMSRILDEPDADTEAVEEHQPSDEPLTPPGMTPLPNEPYIDLAPTPRSTYVNVLTTTPESQVSSLPHIHSPSAIRRQAHAHPVRHDFIPPARYFPYETTLMAQQIPAHAPLDPIFVHPLAAADPAAEHQGLPVAGDLEEILAQWEAEFNERRSAGSPVPMRVVSRREQELLSCQRRYAQEHPDRLPIYQTPEPRTRRTLSSYNYRSRSESPRLSLGQGPRRVSVSSDSDSDMDTQTQTVPPFDDSVTPGPALPSST